MGHGHGVDLAIVVGVGASPFVRNAHSLHRARVCKRLMFSSPFFCVVCYIFHLLGDSISLPREIESEVEECVCVCVFAAHRVY